MPRPLTTRERILRAARDLFVAHGYERTSLKAIAAAVGLTKATILYHFPAKKHIAAELVEPVVADMEAAAERAAEQPPDRRAWAMIEGWLDTVLAHQQVLRMVVLDINTLAPHEQYERLLAVHARAVEIVSGPKASQRERVRAVQALAMVGDPVVYHLTMEAPGLREDILDGVRRFLNSEQHGPRPGPASRRRPGRGRPAALSAEQVSAARALHAAGEQSVAEIAASLGVSRATVYRHLQDL